MPFFFPKQRTLILRENPVALKTVIFDRKSHIYFLLCPIKMCSLKKKIFVCSDLNVIE